MYTTSNQSFAPGSKGSEHGGASLGRFMSPDPSVLDYADPTNPQSLNLYAYALNNPLTNSDPTGLECVWDDGSFDSATDPQTGSTTGCAAAGGTYFDPNTFAAGGGQDWSSAPNAELAGMVNSTLTAGESQGIENANGDTASVSTPGATVSVNGDTGDTSLSTQYLDVSDQIAPSALQFIQLTAIDSAHKMGCIAQAYGVGGPGTALYQGGQPVAGSKRFVTEGSSRGSSPISETLGSLPFKGRFPAPVGGPGTGTPLRWRSSPNLGRNIARWAPFIGAAMDAYATYQLANCY
jgi:hypothetical protein